MLATLGNTDIEKAIRAKNRMDDAKTKDEKTKETKLRLKRNEKKRIEAQMVAARSTTNSMVNKSQLKNISEQ